MPFVDISVTPQSDHGKRIPVRAMLDCGASKTIMCISRLNASEYAADFPVVDFKEKTVLSSALIDACSEILAKAQVTLLFRDKRGKLVPINHEVYLVSGLSHTLFLGNDFIRSAHHVYNTSTEMCIKSSTTPVTDLSRVQPDWHYIPIKQMFFRAEETLLSSETFILEPKQTKLVQVKRPRAAVFEIEAIGENLEAPEVTYWKPRTGPMSVFVSNPNDFSVRFPGNRPIATVVPVTGSDAMIHNITFRTSKQTSQLPQRVRHSFEEIQNKMDDTIELISYDQKEKPMTDEEMLDLVDMSHLPVDVRAKYRKLLQDNLDIFSRTSTDIGCTDLFHAYVRPKEGINPAEFQPKFRPPPLHLKQKIHEAIQKLLDQGVLTRPHDIPDLISNVHIRIKPNGSVRLCLDSRAINYISKRLPTAPAYTMDEVLAMTSQKRVSLIDISQSFFNIPLEPESFQYFSFLDPDRRVLQLTRACQGHHNSPTFQGQAIRLMLDQKTTDARPDFTRRPTRRKTHPTTNGPSQSILTVNPLDNTERFLRPNEWQRPDSDIVLFNIWDDLGAASEMSLGHEGHIRALQLLFNKTRLGRFRLRIQKLQLCPPQLSLLGYQYENGKLMIPPKRLAALHDLKLSTPRQIKSFLASAAYYRTFAPSFSTLAHPLMKLAQQQSLSRADKDSAEEGRKRLLAKLECNATRFVYDHRYPLVLQTDSSKLAAGATLDMVVDGKLVPVSSFSRIFTQTEKNYNIYFKEAITVAEALQAFDFYVKGALEITLITDVKALLFLRLSSDKNPVAFRLSNTISKYPIKVRHAPSKAHFQTDAISRHEEDSISFVPMSVDEALTLVSRIKHTKETYSADEVKRILTLSPPQSLIKPKPKACTKFPVSNPISPLRVAEKRIRKPVFVRDTHENTKPVWRCSKGKGNGHKTDSRKIRGMRPDGAFLSALHVKDAVDNEETGTMSKCDSRNETWSLAQLSMAQDTVEQGTMSRKNFHALQMDDVELQKWLKKPGFRTIMENGLLYVQGRSRNKPFLPTSLLPPLLHLLHFTIHGAHRSREAIRNWIHANYFVIHLDSKMAKYMSPCGICTFAKKTDVMKPPELPNRVPTVPRDTYYLDIMDFGTNTETTGKAGRYFLVAVCLASLYTVLVPLPDRSKESVRLAILNGLIHPFGRPVQLIADNESAFKSSHVMEMLDVFRIQFHAISPQSPWVNRAEVTIKKLKALLRPTFRTFQDWPLVMASVLMALNKQPFRSGRTPEEFFFHSSGPELTDVFPRHKFHELQDKDCEQLTLDLSTEISKRRDKAAQKRSSTNRNRRKKSFDEGQLVTVRNLLMDPSRALHTMNKGPYVILRAFSDNSYEVQHVQTGRVYKKHAAYLFPMDAGALESSLPPSWDADWSRPQEAKKKPVHSRGERTSTQSLTQPRPPFLSLSVSSREPRIEKEDSRCFSSPQQPLKSSGKSTLGLSQHTHPQGATRPTRTRKPNSRFHDFHLG